MYLCADGSRCSRHTPIYLCLHSNMNIRILATGGGIFSTSSICSLRWTRSRRNKFCYNNLNRETLHLWSLRGVMLVAILFAAFLGTAYAADLKGFVEEEKASASNGGAAQKNQITEHQTCRQWQEDKFVEGHCAVSSLYSARDRSTMLIQRASAEASYCDPARWLALYSARSMKRSATSPVRTGTLLIARAIFSDV